MLPCPAPRIAFADGESPDGSRRKRRRRKCVENEEGQRGVSKTAEVLEESSEEGESVVLARMQGAKPP